MYLRIYQMRLRRRKLYLRIYQMWLPYRLRHKSQLNQSTIQQSLYVAASTTSVTLHNQSLIFRQSRPVRVQANELLGNSHPLKHRE